jgi:hypothetical protein
MAERVLNMKVAIEVDTNKGEYREALERQEDEGLDEYIERVVECLRQLGGD